MRTTSSVRPLLKKRGLPDSRSRIRDPGGYSAGKRRTLIERKTWLQVDIACDPPGADELAAELAYAFGIGVEITGAGVRLYFPGRELTADARTRLEAILGDARGEGEHGSSPRYSVSTIFDQDWNESWKAGFKPLRIGRTLVICPTWEKPAAGPADRLLRIDPGQAFGTGHHESTRLCLEWLEDRAATAARGGPPCGSLLDVGTGSGILAMAGALMGFDPVAALDNDPEAVTVAADNVKLNGLEGRVHLAVGTAAALAGRFHSVVANIQALPLVDLAATLCERLRPGGWLVVSGILIDQQRLVREAYERQGLRLAEVRKAGEWCLLGFS